MVNDGFHGLLNGFPARHGGFPSASYGLFQGKSQSQMDGDSGYPYDSGNPRLNGAMVMNLWMMQRGTSKIRDSRCSDQAAGGIHDGGRFGEISWVSIGV